ncbi:MAG: RagB/SusD family nutrient uptake outer membrane protein [Tannerella sp.]|nr:RagB/SusD family nutrient uptake outer membrane protein [Tannerella sp.]
MKKIIFLLIAVVYFSSCSEDFITRNPISNLSSEGFYKTETDMNQAVLSAYQGLRSLYNDNYHVCEIRSDNTTYSWLAGNPANEKGVDDYSQPLFPDNGFPTNIWDRSYNLILRANIVIGRIDEIEFTDPAKKTQFKAEASFLRALMYFYMNRIFGGYATNGELLGPVLVDHEITIAEAYELGRAPLQDVYDLVVSDLQFAEANLPASYGSTDVGRVTSAGASAMLGKVYMTMAGFPLNRGNEYYTRAIEQFRKVINNSSYSLVPTYNALFNVSNKNTSESLFEVQYKKGSADGVTGSPWNNNFAPRFSDKEVVLIGDKGGTNAPTGDMSNAYELGDPRKFVSMRDGWVSANTGAFNQDRYVCKYYDVATSGSDNDNNWIELRLADVYLLYAEALVRTGGSSQEAIDYVNRIRQRARNTPGDPEIEKPANLLADLKAEDYPSPDALLLAIEKERRVELAFENHRWFDLVRTGRARDVMIAEQKNDGYADFTWTDDALSYPIPLTAMEANPGMLIQNRGYAQR